MPWSGKKNGQLERIFRARKRKIDRAWNQVRGKVEHAGFVEIYVNAEYGVIASCSIAGGGLKSLGMRQKTKKARISAQEGRSAVLSPDLKGLQMVSINANAQFLPLFQTVSISDS